MARTPSTMLALGTAAHAQMPGPADAEVIPPWAWSVAVGGLLALVAVLGSALVTLAARYTVAQLRRLDSMEESIRSMRDEVRQMNALSAHRTPDKLISYGRGARGARPTAENLHEIERWRPSLEREQLSI